MNFLKAYRSRLRTYLTLVVVVILIFLTACQASKPSASSPAALSPTPSEVSAEDNALEWLTKAKAAARKMNKYGFELQMNQELGGGANDKNHSKVEITMQGRVERTPLKLDQTIKSNIDGEESTLRMILVPDANYMYLPEFEEWSKLSKEVADENVKTLSDFQVNPEQALQEIQALGSPLTAERSGQVVTIRYDGVSPEATTFVAGILESTMGLSGMGADIQKSLAIQKLKVALTVDAERYWPLSYRIESDMTIEFEPGNKSAVTQTLAGTYSKPNLSAAVTVPKEAQQAIDPDKINEQ
ncbi:DUF6612 family protein [Cohnella silvisoli]|uniref:LppX_LprAFG lipoprotein n=1 Tax=Cohnella silvisoli TaxID=2873699 RepID=A0ABV1KPY3_9BACL|nr:DUF6612 family protein [Cohnella silvisoli]MCD9022223.1 hypothetical protein [Cohnella silvisoli]